MSLTPETPSFIARPRAARADAGRTCALSEDDFADILAGAHMVAELGDLDEPPVACEERLPAAAISSARSRWHRVRTRLDRITRLMVAALATACSDAAAPDRPAHATHAVVGAYTVNAQFDTYSYQDAIGCNTLYCTHTVPARGTMLSGRLVIEDSVLPSSGSTRLPRVTGAFRPERCGAEPRDCDVWPLAFRSYGIVYPDEPTYIDAVGVDGSVAILLTLGVPDQWIRLDGRLSGHRITGTIMWLPSVPRRAYSGSFVATR
jgi:hypothetical protein